MSRRSVLLVDDRAAVRLTLKGILRGFDCDFAEAAEGEAALALIAERPFDVIFLDLKLPDIDGTEVLRRARALRDPLGQVIVLTGLLEPETRDETTRLGVFRHLTKDPINLADVKDAFLSALIDAGRPAPPPPAPPAPAPAGERATPVPAPRARAGTAAHRRNDSRPRILVLDDDQYWLDTIERVLGNEFAVTTTLDAEDACRKAGRTRFDLVILDMKLPGVVTGLDVLVRMAATTSNLKAILLTGEDVDLDTVVGAGRLGARTFFLKSQLSSLPDKVGKILHEPVRPPTAFLSYDRRDQLRVRRLYDRLAERGIQPWMDEQDLLPGADWDKTIGKRIREADHFIFCHSRHSHDKEGTIRRELNLAIDRLPEFREDRHFLIVARLDETEVNGTLCRFHYADLFQRNGFEKLVQAIAADAAART